jgi:thiosulfate dehydrogenase (quinone) large subunit
MSLQAFSLLFLRVALGWMMFYAGITKVFDPAWSPFGYLSRAKTFPEFYALFLDPGVLPIVTFLNAWGLTLIGLALLLGLGVRIASGFAILMMALYYFPVLSFPYIGENSFIIEAHIIYAAGFLVLIAFKAGRVWSLGAVLRKIPIVARIPLLQKILE